MPLLAVAPGEAMMVVVDPKAPGGGAKGGRPMCKGENDDGDVDDGCRRRKGAWVADGWSGGRVEECAAWAGTGEGEVGDGVQGMARWWREAGVEVGGGGRGVWWWW